MKFVGAIIATFVVFSPKCIEASDRTHRLGAVSLSRNLQSASISGKISVPMRCEQDTWLSCPLGDTIIASIEYTGIPTDKRYPEGTARFTAEVEGVSTTYGPSCQRFSMGYKGEYGDVRFELHAGDSFPGPGLFCNMHIECFGPTHEGGFLLSLSDICPDTDIGFDIGNEYDCNDNSCTGCTMFDSFVDCYQDGSGPVAIYKYNGEVLHESNVCNSVSVEPCEKNPCIPDPCQSSDVCEQTNDGYSCKVNISEVPFKTCTMATYLVHHNIHLTFTSSFFMLTHGI